ncbi:MAG: hypothetical protein QUS35_08795 [bacterium]|nr:hypothetical protein [bacterium]
MPISPVLTSLTPGHRNSLMLWLFCFGAGILFCWGMGVNLLDESWFLQVTRRFMSGETLYRDIAYDTPPLPVYAAFLSCLLFGTQLLATKVLLAACFAFTALFFIRAAGHMGFGSPRWTLISAAFMIVYAPPYPNSMYNPTAVLFMTACLERCAAWIREGDAEGSGRRLIGAGIAAGLAAACKQTIGGLALAAAGAVLLERTVAERRSGRWFTGSALRLALPFLAAFFCFAALPILATGTARAFFDYGFLSKGPYLRLASIRYVDQVREWFMLPLHPSWQGLRQAYFNLPWLMPLIVIPGLAFLHRRLSGMDRRFAALLFFFSLASMAGAYPRYDFAHMGILIPGLGLGLFFIGRRLQALAGRRTRRLVFFTGLVWLSAGVLFLGLHVSRSLLGRGSCRSELPHFRHMPMRREEYESLARTTEWIRRAAPDRRVFLLDVRCGFYSLAAELENPTPYDYPLTTMIGQAGHEKLLSMIEKGEIGAVIIRPAHPAWGGLWPAELEAAVRDRMVAAADGGEAGILFVSRPASKEPDPGSAAKEGRTGAGGTR